MPTFYLYLSFFFGVFILSTFCDLPGTDLNLTPSSCSSDNDCPTYYYSKCTSGTCQSCYSDSPCTRFDPNAYCNGQRCFIPCTSSDQDNCREQRMTCDPSGHRCIQCSSASDCVGYPGTIYCDTSGTFGICVNCRNNGDCSGGMTCQNYKCVQCTANSQCPATTPYCLKTFEQNLCKQCLQNSDCTSAATPKCSGSYTCSGCSDATDCTHISGKPNCLSGSCVECTSDSQCTNPAKSYCNPSTHACQACSTSSQCTRLSATPLCAGGSTGCVQCLSAAIDCTSAAASVCSAGSCQRCSTVSDCTNFPSKPLCDTSVGCVECMVDSTCTSTLKSHCNSDVCQLCTVDSHCTHITATPVCSNTATGCVECKLDTSCTNPLKSHCNSGFTCEVCSSNTHCSQFSTTKVCSNSVLGCVECMASTDCQDPAKSFCDISTHTCKLCSSNSECSHLTLTPYCSSTKCTECLTNSHCTAIAKSYCNPATYTCQVCTIDSQCTHLTATPYCSPADSRCAECTANTHCLSPLKSNCVSASKTCQLCTIDSQCSHLTATPRCSGTSLGCVECMVETDCMSTTKSHCNPNNICQICSIDSHCTHIPNMNKCWYGECVIYSPVCIPTYTVQITQESSLNDFVIDFDPILVMKIDILSTIKIQLISIAQTDYTYTITKVTNTQFLVNFQVHKTLPSTKIYVQVPCPTTPGYVYGNITQEITTKKIPFGSADLKAALATLASVASTATTTVGGISAAMVFLGANPALLWGLLGAIQTFYYMLFINVQYPLNVEAFFPIFAMGNLDFIPNPMWIIFPDIDDFSLPVPTKFAEYDVDGLFLANAGNMILLWLGNIGLYLFSYVIIRYTRNMPKLLGMICSKSVETFEWSGIFRVFITSYMELSMAAFLQLRVLTFGSGLFSASSICGIIFGTFGIVLPVLTYQIVKMHDTRPKLVKLKFGTLIEEYRLNDDIQKYFTVISIGRNLILIFSLVYLHDYPYIEIITLTALRFSFAYLLYKYKPYEDKLTNMSNIFSEVIFGMVHIFIFILIHDDYSPSFSDEQRLDLGWGIICGCGIILMTSMTAAITEQVSVMKKMIGLLMKVLKKEKKSRQIRIKKLSKKIKKVNRQVAQVTASDESLATLSHASEMSFPLPQERPSRAIIKRPISFTTERKRKIKR